MAAFTVTCAYTHWTFRPRCEKGRVWLRKNLYGPDALIVERRLGPCIFRALRAEHFSIECVDAADGPGDRAC